MYRDLLEHEDLIVAHPAVSALAAGGRGETSAGFYFDEISDDEVDRRAAPESTPVILDADSSQRASIAAALDGRSFVMDGPPGNGQEPDHRRRDRCLAAFGQDSAVRIGEGCRAGRSAGPARCCRTAGVPAGVAFT